MATDVQAVKAKLLVERQILLDLIALIDVPAEQALIDAAASALAQARATYDKKSKRWTLVNDKLDRLKVVEDQIVELTAP